MDTIFLFGGILMIFYFLAWRPQAKERRVRAAMLEAIKNGDKVLTTSGMYGTVHSLKEHEVVLKVDDKANVKIRFARQAVQTVITPENEKTAATAVASVPANS